MLTALPQVSNLQSFFIWTGGEVESERALWVGSETGGSMWGSVWYSHSLYLVHVGRFTHVGARVEGVPSSADIWCEAGHAGQLTTQGWAGGTILLISGDMYDSMVAAAVAHFTVLCWNFLSLSTVWCRSCHLYLRRFGVHYSMCPVVSVLSRVGVMSLSNRALSATSLPSETLISARISQNCSC